MRRRHLLSLLPGALAAPSLALPSLALAQAGYPARPVRVIVPFPPGGTTDFIARLVGARLTTVFGQTFVVENRAGAGGTLGSDLVAKSPPDGQTLIVSNIASFGVGPSVYRSMPYDSVRDFAHVALMAEIPSVLAVNVSSPIRSLADFIAAAKARPGLNVGSPGNGTSSHAKQAILQRAAGIETTHVPYRGSGPMMNDVAGGALESMITTLVEAGRNERFRLLAVTAAERVPGWPNLPTFKELGYPDLVASTWFGLSAAAGTPEAIVTKLNAEVLAALATPEISARLVETGATPRRMSAADYSAFVAAEVTRWAAVVRDAGIRLD
ncbi:Bug family tripartite tricarboxylate transporter substrate binding protein [Falsiroseomonas selenitidurans]|uniref:Tripartite tricarboxylate transporter substrate binding protein n=1 Tax=Falsiroseomonas selenitidurans TaxID=2716335 RepID=A0ABX1DY15_9PROT|nr:tripartite tricarboxylate transporter substrate binding protein [Falsiroseomonas selenitidurans]NKC29763.1 tripartite tricarboxylate transporter substrate binding protein [Falsiroseomonas selenitidurans]